MNNEFNFKPNDIIEFCGEQYLVIDNFGSSGRVKEYYSNGKTSDFTINFYWSFQGEKCKLIKSA